MYKWAASMWREVGASRFVAALVSSCESSHNITPKPDKIHGNLESQAFEGFIGLTNPYSQRCVIAVNHYNGEALRAEIGKDRGYAPVQIRLTLKRARSSIA